MPVVSAQYSDRWPKAEPLFYIQNRGYCGDCLRWWKADRCGYTSNLDMALKLPETEAKALCASRSVEDFPWPVSEVDNAAERHLNSEHPFTRSMFERIRGAVNDRR